MLASEPVPPELPHADVHIGEVIGHRLWWLIDGQLCSLAHHRIWQPGETIHGDTMKMVAGHVYDPVWGGVYAFRDPISYEEEARLTKEHLERFGAKSHAHFANGPVMLHGLVAGTIKMWGDVVEHELGYRAEFAKVNSIDAVFYGDHIDDLRRRYGVA